MTFMPRMSVCKLLPTAVYAICYKLSPSKWWRVCDHTCFCLCEYVCVWVCMCVSESLHACIMQWWSECVILGCPRSLCVKLSTDQNHRIDTHTRRCKPGGKSKPHTPADLLWPTGHRWVSLLLSRTSHLCFLSLFLFVNISEAALFHSLRLPRSLLHLSFASLITLDESLKVECH